MIEGCSPFSRARFVDEVFDLPCNLGRARRSKHGRERGSRWQSFTCSINRQEKKVTMLRHIFDSSDGKMGSELLHMVGSIQVGGQEVNYMISSSDKISVALNIEVLMIHVKNKSIIESSIQHRNWPAQYHCFQGSLKRSFCSDIHSTCNGMTLQLSMIPYQLPLKLINYSNFCSMLPVCGLSPPFTPELPWNRASFLLAAFSP